MNKIDKYFKYEKEGASQVQADYLIQAADLRKSHKILDAACGRGTVLKRLNKMGFNVRGFDINPDYVEAAKDKHVIVGNLVSIPFKSGTFDRVICSFALDYLYTLSGLYDAMQELKRVCKKDGSVYIQLCSPELLRRYNKEQYTGNWVQWCQHFYINSMAPTLIERVYTPVGEVYEFRVDKRRMQ